MQMMFNRLISILSEWRYVFDFPIRLTLSWLLPIFCRISFARTNPIDRVVRQPTAINKRNVRTSSCFFFSFCGARIAMNYWFETENRMLDCEKLTVKSFSARPSFTKAHCGECFLCSDHGLSDDSQPSNSLPHKKQAAASFSCIVPHQ